MVLPRRKPKPKHLRKSGSYAGRIYRPLGESQTWSINAPKHRKKKSK